MSKMVFPNVEVMSIDDLRQMIPAIYRDDEGWRVLVRFGTCRQPLDISEESGTAVWTAVQEDGYVDSNVDTIEGIGVAVTWTLKPNAYGRLLTVSDSSEMATTLAALMAKAAWGNNPMNTRPRGRQQRVAGVR